jgi:Flp pilus assembly protein TadB
MTQDRFAPLGFNARRQTRGWLAPVMWLAGLVATIVALAVGAVLAVFTAAAVSVLVFFAGLAMSARRKMTVRARRGDDVIEARKVGDTWVTYGWERPGH